MSGAARLAFGALLLAAAAACSRGGEAAEAPPSPFPFLGEARLASDLVFQGTPVGGLSGITYDAGRGVYYAISDDRSERAPARFYTLRIDLAGGRLAPDGVQVLGVTTLLGEDGKPFAEWSLDPEGIAFSAAGTVFVSSEGDTRRGVAPWVGEFGLDGRLRRFLAVPEAYLPGDERGVRDNLAFEALSLTPDGAALFTATENALAQDGPQADRTHRSPSRLLRFDVASGRATAEYLYLVDPLARPPLLPGTFAVNGLVELIALDGEDLLALERSYATGAGNAIRLYRVTLAGADPITGRRRLDLGRDPVQPVGKRLLLDLGELGLQLDNLEGMTLGPALPDGRRPLILVSDDNFSSSQITQVLAFAFRDGGEEAPAGAAAVPVPSPAAVPVPTPAAAPVPGPAAAPAPSP
jgi:hypothetical protein